MTGLLNSHQLDRLSEFVSNLGLVFLASAVTPLFTGVDKANPFIVELGLTLTSGCVAVSLFLLKGVEK
jgi:hypothetical protein